MPMPTQRATGYSGSSHQNARAIVAGSVVSAILLTLIAVVAWIFLRRRRRRQRQRPGFGKESFPPGLISPYTYLDIGRTASVRTVSMPFEQPVPGVDGLSGDQLDQLDYSAPPLQSTDLFLRYSMGTLIETSSERWQVLFSGTTSDHIYSPATRLEQLASQVKVVRQEISALEKRSSVPRDVEEGYVGNEGRRIEELRERIRELEREQATLRLQVEVERETPPPEYTTTE